MKKSPVISSRPPEQPGMDFELLRREAISYIEELGGNYWTDYNTHDPGITILEVLCYAITDLSYRLNYDIKDILAVPPDSDDDLRQFFTAREILTINPVTIEDYRKLIIDVDGVKNAWLEKAEGPSGTKGYYHVYIEPEDETANYDALTEKVRGKLLAHRNLCEDFLTITILPIEAIKIDSDVTIENDADATAVFEEIYHQLADFVSPPIPLLTLDEMLVCSYGASEIFEGPSLEHGFIDTKSLEAAKWKSQLHASDLIHLIQAIPGVKSVKSLKMLGAQKKWHEWALDITPGHAPRWKKEGDIRLFKGNIICRIDKQRLKENQPSIIKRTLKTFGKRAVDLIVPLGTYRSLYDYETIQNELPLNYGIGHFGLPEDVSKSRKAQANQLRAYLMLFDQILANYFAQLEYAKDLLSPYGEPTVSYFSSLLPEDTESKISQKSGSATEEETYIVKLLKTDDEDIKEILEPLARVRKRRENLIEELQEIIEESSTAMERRNRLFNHLLARFGEEYAAVSTLYGSDEITKKYLTVKQKFLQKYPVVSSDRARAFNYSEKSPVWDSENVSGLEQRIAFKLGITDFRMRRLSTTELEGFHFIEHILLLPFNGEEPTDIAGQQDNYSFHVSFVFPDWSGRFQDKSFQRFVEEVIWSETPAHIHTTVHWRNRDYLKEFEKWYEIWQQQRSAESPKASKAAQKLIELLNISRAEKS